MLHELDELGGLQELVAFVAVGEAGSFTSAARVVGRDASVLSRRISQLEQRLGVRLLSRTTRRVALTEIGASYFQRMQVLLDELAGANREVSEHAGSPQGILRVSLPASFGRQWIAPLIPAFLARHPKIRIDLRLTDRFVDVVAEGIDVSIRVTAERQRDSSLATRKIAAHRNLLVAAPSYLSAHGTPQSPADLMQHACLAFTGYKSWPDWHLKKDGRRHTVRPTHLLISDDAEMILMAAIKGAGITFTADWLAGPALHDGQLVEVLPGWGGRESGGVYAILPPGRLVPTKTRLFVDEITQAIKVGWTRRVATIADDEDNARRSLVATG